MATDQSIILHSTFPQPASSVEKVFTSILQKNISLSTFLKHFSINFTQTLELEQEPLAGQTNTHLFLETKTYFFIIDGKQMDLKGALLWSKVSLEQKAVSAKSRTDIKSQTFTISHSVETTTFSFANNIFCHRRKGTI